jgi:OmpA family protein
VGLAVFRKSLCLVSLGAFCFALGGCAYNGPAAPSFAAMPGRGKSYEAFQRDDQYCQSSAQQAIGYQSPGEAANQASVGSAAVGTALGALAGAAIGSVSGNMGAGAALGAGTGLVAGSAVGAGNARAAGGSLQVRYDTVYAQCMTAKGNRIADHPSLNQSIFIRTPITGVLAIIILIAGNRKFAPKNVWLNCPPSFNPRKALQSAVTFRGNSCGVPQAPRHHKTIAIELALRAN